MNSLREEIAWLIVERMNDSVGFDEAYQEVGEYLKLVVKRIDSLEEPYDTGEGELTHGFNMARDRIKEMLK